MGRALHFATKNSLVLEEELGFGVHGIVWSTDQKIGGESSRRRTPLL